jgi:hypothetical protein
MGHLKAFFSKALKINTSIKRISVAFYYVLIIESLCYKLGQEERSHCGAKAIKEHVVGADV